MNMISNILKQLPGLKSASDFDAAITTLERELAEATTAVNELEGKREDLIFSGGNLSKLEADILAAESRVKTFGIAITGATKRRTEAVEAEAQAELEAKGKAAVKMNAKLKTTLIAFATTAETLAGHAAEIKQLRAEILTANNAVREGGRGDLVQHDPVRGLVELAERQVADSVKGLVIPEFWPAHPDGAALSLLRK